MNTALSPASTISSESTVSISLDEPPEKARGGGRDVRIKVTDRGARCLDDNGLPGVSDLEELEEAGQRVVDWRLCECYCDDVAGIGKFVMTLDDLYVGIENRDTVVENRDGDLQKRRAITCPASPEATKKLLMG